MALRAFQTVFALKDINVLKRTHHQEERAQVKTMVKIISHPLPYQKSF